MHHFLTRVVYSAFQGNGGNMENRSSYQKETEDLIWYYENLNKEGRETLLKVARSFVATGEFSRADEISEELYKHLKMHRAIIEEMRYFNREIPD